MSLYRIEVPETGYIVDTIEIKNPIIVYYDHGIYVFDSTVINRPDFNIKTFVKDSVTYICGDAANFTRLLNIKSNVFDKEQVYENIDVLQLQSPVLKPKRKDSKGHTFVAFQPQSNSTKFFLAFENVFYYNLHTFETVDWDSCPKNCLCKDAEYEIKAYSPINTYVRVVYQIK